MYDGTDMYGGTDMQSQNFGMCSSRIMSLAQPGRKLRKENEGDEPVFSSPGQCWSS